MDEDDEGGGVNEKVDSKSEVEVVQFVTVTRASKSTSTSTFSIFHLSRLLESMMHSTS